MRGKLAYACCLSHTVHAYHQNDRRRCFKMHCGINLAEHLAYNGFQFILDIVSVCDSLCLYTVAQALYYLPRGLTAYIRHDESFFKLFKKFLIHTHKDLEHIIDLFAYCLLGFSEALLQFFKKSHIRLQSACKPTFSVRSRRQNMRTGFIISAYRHRLRLF